MNHLNSFCRGMFKLNAKFGADSLLYSFSHFECDGHTVHMLTQRHLRPPLTTIIKLSLFMEVHSSPLSLAAGLHQCCTSHSHYINNGWTFFRQTSYICIYSLYFPYMLLIYLYGLYLYFNIITYISPCYFHLYSCLCFVLPIRLHL